MFYSPSQAPMMMPYTYQGAGFRQPMHVNNNPYGTQDEEADTFKNANLQFAARKRRFNLVAIAMSLFLPWTIFCIVFALYSFESNYYHPMQVRMSAAAILVFILWIGSTAFKAAQQSGSFASWHGFIFATSLLSWSAGIYIGTNNFAANTKSYYDIANLNSYNAIDPSKVPGAQLMDGGRINFDARVTVDVKRSMGFKNDKMYCVAPITMGDSPLESYDFWAVGTDCCDGTPGHFQCEEFANSQAHSGLRVMRDDLRDFYRLAVQQVQSKYQLKTTHPIFLSWVSDADARLDAVRMAGFKYYFTGLFLDFFFQMILVVMAASMFAQSGC